MINVVKYRDSDGRVHWASKAAPDVVAGLASGELTPLDYDGSRDAPEVPDDGAPADTGPSDY